ncbi:hypothetical protein Trydic_g3934 [Trypoxylus dichotomus]
MGILSSKMEMFDKDQLDFVRSFAIVDEMLLQQEQFQQGEHRGRPPLTRAKTFSWVVKRDPEELVGEMCPTTTQKKRLPVESVQSRLRNVNCLRQLYYWERGLKEGEIQKKVTAISQYVIGNESIQYYYRKWALEANEDTRKLPKLQRRRN